MLLPETLLQGMQPSFGRQSLDCRNRGPIGLDCEDRARLDAPAIDQHGAGAALTRVAADMGASEPQVLAQEVNEKYARFDGAFANLAVDGERHLDHRLLMWWRRGVA